MGWANESSSPVFVHMWYTFVVYVPAGMYVQVYRSEVKVSSLTALYYIFETESHTESAAPLAGKASWPESLYSPALC